MGADTWAGVCSCLHEQSGDSLAVLAAATAVSEERGEETESAWHSPPLMVEYKAAPGSRLDNLLSASPNCGGTDDSAACSGTVAVATLCATLRHPTVRTPGPLCCPGQPPQLVQAHPSKPPFVHEWPESSSSSHQHSHSGAQLRLSADPLHAVYSPYLLRLISRSTQTQFCFQKSGIW